MWGKATLKCMVTNDYSRNFTRNTRKMKFQSNTIRMTMGNC